MQSRLWIALLLALMFTACSKHQPPVQMMAEARAALQAAHDLTPPSNHPNENNITPPLAAADYALHQAAQALSTRHFGEARQQAKHARDLARQFISQYRQAKQHLK